MLIKLNFSNCQSNIEFVKLNLHGTRLNETQFNTLRWTEGLLKWKNVLIVPKTLK